jgi:hypothetical protein
MRPCQSAIASLDSEFVDQGLTNASTQAYAMLPAYVRIVYQRANVVAPERDQAKV